MERFSFECSRDGTACDDAEAVAAIKAIASGVTDLIVISHGWNNDKADATALYNLFFQRFEELRGSDVGYAMKDRRFAAICIFWPSKKFTDIELIPGGAAAMTGSPQDSAAAVAALQELKSDPIKLGVPHQPPSRAVAMDEAISLLPSLETNPSARQRYVELLRSVSDRGAEHPDDGTDAFFQKDAEELFSAARGSVIAPPPANRGGAASQGPAAGIRDLSNDALAAARRLANFTTYYQMKRRAGDVGRAGVAPLLQRIREAVPSVNLHLIGHSFGGRVVAAAALALPPGTQRSTMVLLQAAFSHNGFSPDFDGRGHRGAFREVIASKLISGPIIITHTRNDQAVGVAYPLASRISHDMSAALGDANDPYGGMGRNGAQHTAEAQFGRLLDLGEVVSNAYLFRPGTIYNLNADAFIADHSDICKYEVMSAIFAAIQASESAQSGSKRQAGAVSFRGGGSADDAPSIDDLQDCLASSAVLPAIFNPERLRRWKLPEDADTPGSYMVELNVRNKGGLPAAEARFLTLYRSVVSDDQRQPVRIAKTYFSCFISTNECKGLVVQDEMAAQQDAGARSGDGPRADHRKFKCIYRVWPDFPLKAQIDNSLATVKADAALNSYNATGNRIVWAVIDSGVDQTHPHFGDPADPSSHTLLSEAVEDLHRCFVRIPTGNGPVKIPMALDNPDVKPPGMSDVDWAIERPKRLEQHRKAALTDELGHGTHVGGIIAGDLSSKRTNGSTVTPRVFMRKLESDGDGGRLSRTVVERTGVEPARLRGVAPKCRLVSLKVLNVNGEGRASDVIRALEYIREEINDDPKLLRVHGVNLSVGYEFDAELFACGRSPLCAAVDRLVQSGVIVVTAAGNTGYGAVAADQRNGSKSSLSNTINDPGNAAGAITVGATHRDAPHTYGVSFFSSKGPTGDGRLKPDLVAPGERITSCAVGAKRTELGNVANNGPIEAYYVDDSGTSMAAPHVSGAIAAFLSIRREFIGKPAEVKALFTTNATSLGRERYFQGHGLIDLMRTIQAV